VLFFHLIFFFLQIQQFEKDIARLNPQKPQGDGGYNPFDSTPARGTNSNPFSNPYAARVEEDEKLQRAKLLEGKQRIEDTSDRLAHMQQVGFETEQIGADALAGLHGQRVKLEKADQDVRCLLALAFILPCLFTF